MAADLAWKLDFSRNILFDLEPGNILCPPAGKSCLFWAYFGRFSGARNHEHLILIRHDFGNILLRHDDGSCLENWDLWLELVCCGRYFGDFGPRKHFQRLFRRFWPIFGLNFPRFGLEIGFSDAIPFELVAQSSGRVFWLRWWGMKWAETSGRHSVKRRARAERLSHSRYIE